MVFRFLHSSDLHLGRRFANIAEPPDGNLRGRLMEARFAKIRALAGAAQAQGAGHVLLAGDTFDSATPSPQVLRQALIAMGEAAGVEWWLLPGNHDNLRHAEPVWDEITRDGPANVHALRDTSPVEIAPGVMLLPCPVPVRATGRDLTEGLPGIATPEGALRIGLAHGGVVDFTESGEQIPPDRDRSAGLDYLALGDWHGRLAVSARTQYSGTPEQDRFKHGVRGHCLAVTLTGAGAAPEVAEIVTGDFLWSDVALPLHEGEDAAAALEALLPATGRRDTLLRIRASGWATLAGHAALRAAAVRQAPEFALLDLVTEGLGTLHDVTDLDAIDHAGAMRLAAARLMDAAGDAALSEDDRDIAAAALNRLYVYATEAPR
ncbi:metallophosphoesterase family protein [Roseicyclus mahoneyensis]|uniref:Calcineurin-like phosphoesterase family protein n=1 Tax=Roseicyclus mahoneyensis TaxID=164332 RepID=A0A316GJ32_9RHOB|nr:metallophosphoesterase [Roseicyclus mahoneyensis]PWK60243.1 calcineurin-like phosphoesterase family protein [Roseicyclus mahoneyensis]